MRGRWGGRGGARARPPARGHHEEEGSCPGADHAAMVCSLSAPCPGGGGGRGETEGGALATARCVADLSRGVLAVPGCVVGLPNASSNRLLRERAISDGRIES